MALHRIAKLHQLSIQCIKVSCEHDHGGDAHSHTYMQAGATSGFRRRGRGRHRRRAHRAAGRSTGSSCSSRCRRISFPSSRRISSSHLWAGRARRQGRRSIRALRSQLGGLAGCRAAGSSPAGRRPLAGAGRDQLTAAMAGAGEEAQAAAGAICTKASASAARMSGQSSASVQRCQHLVSRSFRRQ